MPEVGSASRNAGIMGAAAPEAQGSTTVMGSATPYVAPTDPTKFLPAGDPKTTAFWNWVSKQPEFGGLGGRAKAQAQLPALIAKFEPIWTQLQTSKAGAPAATAIPKMTPPPGTPPPLSGVR